MSDPEFVHALYSDYGRIHFLINRKQCPASVFAGKPIQWDSGFRYFGERISLNKETVPLFNLHFYLKELFHFTFELKAYLVILVPIDSLSEEVKVALTSGPLSYLSEQPRRLGIQISSETAIKQIPLRELQPHPRRLRGMLRKAGLPAVHPLGGTFGYLVDLYRVVAASSRIAEVRV